LKRPENLFRSLGYAPKMLLVRLRSLGDVVLMTPLLESIYEARPDIMLDVAVEHPFSEALYENPYIHRLLELRSARPAAQRNALATPEASPRTLSSRPWILWRIRKAHYDVVWNLHGGNTSAWITGLSGARYRIGCTEFRHQFAYNILIPPSGDLLGRKMHHTVERNLAWFDWLSGESRKDFSEAPALTVLAGEAAQASAEEKLRAAGIDPHTKYAVIQPTAVFATKEWMGDRFAAVADFLISEGYQVVLTGAPGERTKLEGVKSMIRVPAGLLSNLSVQELIAAIQGASLYLGNDSGPAHIAAAVRKPTVILFGSSNSAAWSPWKTRSEVVQNSFDCNPCAGYSCWKYGEPECIKSISVEQVKEAVKRILLDRTG
jgi:lipopolysaccharide heptosyltransferase III